MRGCFLSPERIAEDGTIGFPEFSPDGKPIPGSGLRFVSRIEEGPTTPTNSAMAGMAICNGHSGATEDKAFEEYLTAAGADANRWRNLAEDFRSFPEEFYRRRDGLSAGALRQVGPGNGEEAIYGDSRQRWAARCRSLRRLNARYLRGQLPQPDDPHPGPRLDRATHPRGLDERARLCRARLAMRSHGVHVRRGE